LGTPLSGAKKTALLGICLVKILAIGVLLWMVSLIPHFNIISFSSGLILPLPIILVTILIKPKVT
jgi:hypothetical protein